MTIGYPKPRRCIICQRIFYSFKCNKTCGEKCRKAQERVKRRIWASKHDSKLIVWKYYVKKRIKRMTPENVMLLHDKAIETLLATEEHLNTIKEVIPNGIRPISQEEKDGDGNPETETKNDSA